MTFAALAVALLIAVGLPLSFAVTRRLLFAAALAPLVTAMLGTVAIVAMLAVGGSLWVWLAVVFVLQCVLTVVLLRRRIEPVEHATAADACWLTVPLLPPAVMALSPATAWDAHSIWWLHAGYFTKGATVARQAMTEPAVAFSHTDYPPLASAPVATVWQVFGAVDFRVAHTVSALITLSAIVMLAFAVRRLLGQAPPALARLAGVLVGLATWSTDPLTVTAGYSDALWAAAFVAGALPLLLGRVARPLDLGLLAVATLSKNEGFVAVVVLAVLLTLRRPARQELWRLWLPVAIGASWVVLTRAIGTTNDLQADGNFTELFALDPEVWRRLAPTLQALWAHAGVVLAIALLVTLLGALGLRRRRRDLDLGGDLWLWLWAAIYTGILIFTYLTSYWEIEYHLRSSMARVSLPLVLLACATCAIWAVVAVRRPTPAVDAAVPAQDDTPQDDTPLLAAPGR